MNIYCFSTLSFAKLQFKSVINKAFHKHGVASFTDAWIETDLVDGGCLRPSSHLLQMRGLKLLLPLWCMLIGSRIFYRCVDWNTFWAIRATALPCRIFYRCVDWNFEFCSFLTCYFRSHLLQMRGLKLKLVFWKRVSVVASFTDAWIETVIPVIRSLLLSRIFYRCVDWNVIMLSLLLVHLVASFTDAWIETLFAQCSQQLYRSHLLQMRGLKQPQTFK